jgi:hypothetical protein
VIEGIPESADNELKNRPHSGAEEMLHLKPRLIAALSVAALVLAAFVGGWGGQFGW